MYYAVFCEAAERQTLKIIIMNVYKYKDGAKAKHFKNRSVSVSKYCKENNITTIQFAKADGNKDDFLKPCAENIVIKNRV